jgi:hypothetical protein
MEKETIELRHLKASKGKKLTDGNVYVDEVYLAPSEDESKWHEIDEKDVPTEPIADEYQNTEPEE